MVTKNTKNIMLKNEFEYYIANQDKFVSEYKGKFLVIKEQKIIGIYDTEIEAYNETVKEHVLGTFLIQECQPGEENYTQTFRTRAIFR